MMLGMVVAGDLSDAERRVLQAFLAGTAVNFGTGDAQEDDPAGGKDWGPERGKHRLPRYVRKRASSEQRIPARREPSGHAGWVSETPAQVHGVSVFPRHGPNGHVLTLLNAG
jgi:hypothetical protein